MSLSLRAGRGLLKGLASAYKHCTDVGSVECRARQPCSVAQHETLPPVPRRVLILAKMLHIRVTAAASSSDPCIARVAAHSASQFTSPFARRANKHRRPCLVAAASCTAAAASTAATSCLHWAACLRMCPARTARRTARTGPAAAAAALSVHRRQHGSDVIQPAPTRVQRPAGRSFKVGKQENNMACVTSGARAQPSCHACGPGNHDADI